jgi:PAS domain S-box-containing protein
MSNDLKATILIVDDDDAGRYSIAKILKLNGFGVSEARDGREAIELARSNPDVILLDVHLPDQSGFEVCRAIKADPHTQYIPVLHLSATAISDEERAAGLEGGADAYLTQPIEPELLLATVKSLLRTRRAEAEARAAAGEWQRTFDSVGHGIALLDSEGRILRCNRAMAHLTGTDPEKLIGQPHDAPFRGTDPPGDGWPFDRARRSGQTETAEIYVQGRWLRITADPVRDDRGRFAGAVRTVVDMTERRQAEQDREHLLTQLEQERARLDTVLQQLPIGVIFADAPSGKILVANDQVSRIFRLRKDKILETSEYKGFHA